jgi:glycosyltransferase involved in cell wall biosynthesis
MSADATRNAEDRTRQSLVRMRDELWRLESRFDSYDIGPGAGTIPLPDFGRRCPGVNVLGLVESEKGVGEAVRTTLRSLQAAHIRFSLNNFADSGSENRDRTYSDFSADAPHRINLLHVGADVFPDLMDQPVGRLLADRFNIACWAWETNQFPREWEDRFQYLDEIWVPSQFSHDAIAAASRVPVVRIPHSIPEWLPMAACDRAHFGIPADAFVFLFIFDLASSAARKNPLGLIKAFKAAFGSSDRAMLILKSAHSKGSVTATNLLTEAANCANIRFIDRVLPRAEVNALMNLCDCYVSLHRSEGFGLTIAEAMSLGKPVIATEYSGNTDFTNSSNTFPVRYRISELEQDDGPYRSGSVWADPDLDHAAELMRYVFENRQAATEIGRVARRDILLALHPRIVGDMIKRRLERIPESRSGVTHG